MLIATWLILVFVVTKSPIVSQSFQKSFEKKGYKFKEVYERRREKWRKGF